jgi:nitrite reductase (NADH) small subunit
MSAFQTVCKVQDVIEGEGKSVAVNNKILALFRVGDAYFAIDDICPHMGASLSGGYVENNIVTCPWHAWRFRVTDGAWADNPRIKIGCYPVRVVGDDLQIQVPDHPARNYCSSPALAKGGPGGVEAACQEPVPPSPSQGGEESCVTEPKP